MYIMDTRKLSNEMLFEYCHFPSFPNLDLIVDLSGRMYEKQECKSNIAFLPQQYNEVITLTIEFRDKITFDGNNLRSIRKLLELVDKDHCLISKVIDGKHQIAGISTLSSVQEHAITVICIEGHLHWNVKIHKCSLFEYVRGDFYHLKDSLETEDVVEKLKKRFPCMGDEISNCFAEIMDLLKRLNHGTSLVIVDECEKDEEDYKTEFKRLTNPKVGHGIALNNFLDFVKDKDKHLAKINQITKIDGGLLFDTSGKCKSLGCIFDGTVYDGFEGDSGRGSRYNSIKLYIDCKRRDNINCMGVVVSDDGYIDLI